MVTKKKLEKDEKIAAELKTLRQRIKYHRSLDAGSTMDLVDIDTLEHLLDVYEKIPETLRELAADFAVVVQACRDAADEVTKLGA